MPSIFYLDLSDELRHMKYEPRNWVDGNNHNSRKQSCISNHREGPKRPRGMKFEYSLYKTITPFVLSRILDSLIIFYKIMTCKNMGPIINQ